MKTSNAVCNKCKAEGKIWYRGKWWCAIETDFGDFNMKGYCKKDKKYDSDEKQ